MATANDSESHRTSVLVPLDRLPESDADADLDSDADSDADADEGSDSAGVPHARRKSAWSRPETRIAAWLLSLVVVATGTWLVLQTRDNPTPATGSAATQQAGVPGGTSASGGSPASGQPAKTALRTLTDRADGYRLQYPAAWTELPQSAGAAAASGQVIRIDAESAFSIRTFPLQRAFAANDLSGMRAVTDAILSSPSAKLTVLDVREVDVAGHPAIYYLYYFPDGKQRGIHAHYFVFAGAKMYTLVFQVVPDGKFADYATEFDNVISSFKLLTR